MAMSGTGGSLATELSRGGHGWWRAGDVPHAGFRGGTMDLSPQARPRVPALGLLCSWRHLEKSLCL